MEEEEEDMPVFGENLMELMHTGGKYPMAVEDLSDDEKEDYYIKDSDALIVTGKIVSLSPLRKKITPVFRYTSTSKKKTTSLSITKSCFQPFLLISNGLKLAWVRLTAATLPKATTPSLPPSSRK